MKPIEYDVYVCCHDPSENEMAATVAAGLTRLGFRVFVGARIPGATPDEQRLKLIEDTPDFVILSSPGAAGSGGGDPDSPRAEIAHAFKTSRNVVMMSRPGDVDPFAGAGPPRLPRLAPWQRTVFNSDRSRESIAVLGHRLLSSSEVQDRRLMRIAKWGFTTAALILVAAVAMRAVPAAVEMWKRPKPKPPLPPFTLYWSAFGQRPDQGRWTEFSFGNGSTVSGGDQVKMVFSASADGVAYVLSRNAQGDISLLYPDVTIRGASRVRAGVVYEVPPRGAWLTVDEPAGLETIYVLAGYEPLENLEELVEESGANGDPAVRRELLGLTLAGLLDGRHAVVQPPIRTRNGQAVLDSLPAGPGPLEYSATLANGSVVTHRFATQRGLVSALVEIRTRGRQAP